MRFFAAMNTRRTFLADFGFGCAGLSVCLARERVELRLRVERLQVRDAAGEKDPDDRFRPRGMVRGRSRLAMQKRAEGETGAAKTEVSEERASSVHGRKKAHKAQKKKSLLLIDIIRSRLSQNVFLDPEGSSTEIHEQTMLNSAGPQVAEQ